MKITPAIRTAHITYAIRDLVEESKKLEKQGKTILHLNIGDPMIYDFKTPQHMFDAVVENHPESQGYSDSYGIREARQAIARDAVKRNIKNITEDDVIITSGSSEGIMYALGALLNPGDNVLTPNPGYPLYNALINYFGGVMNPYYLDEENGWQPDLENIKRKINDRTKAIVLIDPNNPTGSLSSKETLLGLIAIARENKLMIFADEAYSMMLLDDEKHHPIASLCEDIPILTFGTLSKNFLAPGWRVGWTIFSGPREHLVDYKEAFAKLLRARLCSVHSKQYAVMPALEGNQSHIHETNAKLKKRRDITFKKLNEIPGLSLVRPKAGFYAFPRINFPCNDREFVLKLLREENVLFVDGSGFGQKEGTNHFRVVFLPEEKILEDAYNRLESFMKRNYTDRV